MPKRNATTKHNYKRLGISVIFAGLVIASLGGILFWQQVDALSNKGWTYVGLASQYQDTNPSDTTAKRVIVNVYACKQSIGATANTPELFEVKAYATQVHNSTDSNYAAPRLEISARDTTLTRYSTSATISLPSSTESQAPFTDKAFPAETTLYYGFNNHYQGQQSGEAQYAIGSISKLIRC